MLPLDFDIRSYFRKHQIGEEVDDEGRTEPLFDINGPFPIAFRPGQEARTITEQGYAYDQTVYYCIADGCDCFVAGDILTDGVNDLYRIEAVKTFPTEQTFYARAI